MSKIKQRQINSTLPKILKVSFNNGTGVRSTVTSASGVIAVPGATGDTSYTAPADQDVDIEFIMCQMINPNGGTGRVWLSINGASVEPGTYQESLGAGWSTQTTIYKYQLAAGATITIGARYSMTAGTLTITNANVDSTYPNYIIGLVIPRIT